MNDTGNGFAFRHHRKHDTKERNTRCKVESAIDRIDCEGKLRIIEAGQQSRIVRAGFLTDDHRIGKAFLELGSDEPFSIHIRFRHQIGG